MEVEEKERKLLLGAGRLKKYKTFHGFNERSKHIDKRSNTSNTKDAPTLNTLE